MPKYVATIPNGAGKYDGVGAKSHEFDSPDLECAQAYCDAMDWRLEGRVVHGGSTIVPIGEVKGEAKKVKGSPAYPIARGPGNSDRLLTMRQIKVLCQLIKSAYDHMDRYGLIEGVDESASKSKQADQWRKLKVKEITGKDSMRKCYNSEFRKIEAEMLKLGGSKYENPKALQTGKQSHRKADTMENREQAIWLINKQLKEHQKTMSEKGQKKEMLNEGYVLSIARSQNKGTELADYDALIALPADKLSNLFYTVRNRCNSKEGKFI